MSNHGQPGLELQLLASASKLAGQNLCRQRECIQLAFYSCWTSSSRLVTDTRLPGSIAHTQSAAVQSAHNLGIV